MSYTIDVIFYLQMEAVPLEDIKQWTKYNDWVQGKDALTWTTDEVPTRLNYLPNTHTFQLVFTPSRPPQTGFPLRWTTDEESSDLYSPNNDEQPHLWELEVYMDCDALAESDGYFAFSAYMVDSTNNNSVEEENEVDQDVCEGGIDEGMEDNAERRVHYGL